MEKDSHEEAVRVEARLEALDDAKAIAAAACAFALGKKGDRLPSPADYRRCLEPYLKANEKSALDRISWTFPGGDLATIPDIAQTELGRVSAGKYGEAIAFADGHAKMSTE